MGSSGLFGYANSLHGLGNWLHWDGGWYYYVVVHGYHYQVITPPVQQSVVFFPAYPLLVRFTHDVTGLSYPYAGVLINFILVIGIALVTYKLYGLLKAKYGAKKDTPADSQISGGLLAVALILAFPTAFFLAAYYADALLLFCFLAALYASFKKHYISAAVLAGLASGSKIIGIVAMVAVLVVFLEQEVTSLKDITQKLKFAMRFIGLAILSLWGILLYIAFLAHKFKSPFAFYTDEKAWPGKGTGSSFMNIWHQNYAHLFSPGYFGAQHINYLVALSNMAIPILAVGILIYAIYKRVWWIVCYVFALIVICLSSGSLTSVNRYGLMLAPVIIYLCAITSKRTQNYVWVIVCILAVIELIFATVFLQGNSNFIG